MEQHQDVDSYLDSALSSDVETTELPKVEQKEQPASAKAPSMYDPNNISVGDMLEGDGLKIQLDEDDKVSQEFGDQTIVLSKKNYTIKDVSVQEDVFKSRVVDESNFIKSRDGSTRWIQTRLEITYEDCDYKSSLPNVKWFEPKYADSNGKYVWRPSIQQISTEKEYKSQYISVASKLYYKFCQSFGLQAGKYSLNKFLEELKGKQVQLREVSSEYDGKIYHRLEIYKFITQ